MYVVSTFRVRRDRLKNVSNEYDLRLVHRNYPAKYYVEYNLDEEFSPGKLFYRLEKPELVKADRTILLRSKADGRVYSGRKARELLGLPMTTDLKVKPNENNDWEIFVQSNSVNRVLRKGTLVLVKRD